MKKILTICFALVLIMLLWGARSTKTSHGIDSRGLGMLKDVHVSYGVFDYYEKGTKGGLEQPPHLNTTGLAKTIFASLVLLGVCGFALKRP